METSTRKSSSAAPVVRITVLSQKYGTVKTYKAQIATHIKPALGAVKLTKLTPHIIQGFYNDLLANGRIVPKRDKQGKIIKKDGVAVTETALLNAKTVRNVHGVLTKALSQASRWATSHAIRATW